ncbi:winged helix-turn-helix transcriptional regulator [Niallia nealsonii]|uniref:Transcriptional regulator n=1 Tax=Niallia nealsonii TaxID=115979 RepID=A0A2N0YYW4_9BACI|nr:winged helix-turn-helix transcriptional regulator [Niallia nealsonii]PKG22450.1 transcriptional regulator [Niallia nealsonii]
MNLLGKRWIGLIVTQLLSGKKRFSDIENSLPISGRLLSERLKELEELGVVDRKVFPEVPVRIEYLLTDKGKELEMVINSIAAWATKWGEAAEKKE